MKRIVSCLLALLLLTGCTTQMVLQGELDFPVEKLYIGFSKINETDMTAARFQQKEADFFDSYSSEFDRYRCSLYYDTLTPADQKFYHILQYAMDQAYPCILLDERLLEEMQCSVEEVVMLLSLDSAVVEQNLEIETMQFSMTSVENGKETTLASMKKLYISDFSQDKQDKKKQAIAQAEQILAQMPAGLTQTQKSEYFFTWLGEHVAYLATDTQEPLRDHLYDALCTGSTNCDGFANAFSLLCNMAGLACAEKIYTPADKGVGHTWNILRLDGDWYNVDATASSEVNNEPAVLMHFGFADSLQEYVPSYTDRVPACENHLFTVDVTLGQSDDIAKQVTDAWQNGHKEYVIVRMTDGSIETDVLQDIADRMKTSLSTRYYPLADGGKLYCIYKQ